MALGKRQEFRFLREDLDALQQVIDSYDSQWREVVGGAHDSTVQSSETWHDNPQFDDVQQQAKMLQKERDRLEAIYRQSQVVKPAGAGGAVDVGVRVHLRHLRSQQLEVVTIGSYVVLDHDRTRISYASPLAQLLLGRVEGDVVVGVVGGGPIALEILGVEAALVNTTSPSPLSLVSTTDDLRVERDGVILAKGGTDEEVIEPSQRLAGGLPLGAGVPVTFHLPPAGKAAVLDEFRPADPAGLRERWDQGEANDDEVPERNRPALDDGVTVDGNPWGWFGAKDMWRLVPLGAGEEVAHVEAPMSASMTGDVITATIRRLDPTTAIISCGDDVDGLRSLDVRYGLAGPEWNDLLVQTARTTFADFDWLCPTCDEPATSEITIELDAGVFNTAGVGGAIGMIYRPCDKHRTELSPGGDRVLERKAGHDWSWQEDAWIPVEADHQPAGSPPGVRGSATPN